MSDGPRTWKRTGVRARKVGHTWYVRISWRGTRREFSTDAKSRTEAEKIGRTKLSDWESGRNEPAADRSRVADLYRDLRCDYEINGRRVRDLEKRWKGHLEPVFGTDLARDVTTLRIRKYVEDRLAEGAARATVRLELAALRRAFRLGMQAGQVVRVPHFPTITVHNARSGFVDGERFDGLLAELPEHLRPVAVLAYWTGWRRGEILGLEWRQLALDSGEIRLDPGTTKNKDGRVVFLPPEALEFLRAWKQSTSCLERDRGIIVARVCHQAGRPIRDFYSSWRKACAAAGVPGLLFHDLRRSAARNYVRSGVPERVVMEILGHRTRSIFDRYNIVSETDLRDAAQRVVPTRNGGEMGKVVTLRERSERASIG
jgi:integrase